MATVAIPSGKTHAKMATLLTAELKTRLGW
jgi:hypothetical protein